MNTYYITENNSGGYYETEFRFDNPFIVDAANEDNAITAFENWTGLTWSIQNKYGPGGNSCSCCGVRFTISDWHYLYADRHARPVPLVRETERRRLLDDSEAFDRYIAEVI